MVNTVQRSPFFKDIILTMGSFNFAIWKEGVMVRNTCRFNCNHKNHVLQSTFTHRDKKQKINVWLCLTSGRPHHPVAELWADLHCGVLVLVPASCFLHWEKGWQHWGVEPAGKNQRTCTGPGTRHRCQDHLHQTLDRLLWVLDYIIRQMLSVLLQKYEFYQQFIFMYS